jgi:2-desacetyl-2-hydroxyethyl bacteriochlorophyllide A dehydrogenase
MKITAIEIVGPRAIELVEDTLPDPKHDEMEIRSLFSGISHGTEMNVYRGDAPMWSMRQDRGTHLFLESPSPQWSYPMRYGYACVGEVTNIGAGVSRFDVGDIVFCYGNHQTGHVLPERAVVKLPKDVDPRVGVLLANLNTTFNGILDADLHLQECVVVFGQGVLGQLTVQWAKLSGADPVIAVDLIDRRLQVSLEASGADHALNPKKLDDIAMAVRDITDGLGADVAFEVSASDRALNEAIRTVCYNGMVVVLSWYPDALPNVFLGREFHHNRVRLVCSQTGGIRPELSHRWSLSRRMQAVLSLMPGLQLEGLISDIVDYQAAAAAYELVDKRPQDTLQVVLEY